MSDREPTNAELRDDIRSIAADVATMKRFVVGDSEPERSLVYRVADLERSRKGVARIMWTAATSAAAGAGLWAWNRLTHGK